MKFSVFRLSSRILSETFRESKIAQETKHRFLAVNPMFIGLCNQERNSSVL
jgi:hypothetical protein